MATPQGRTRTNYFAVTDKEAFRQMVEALVCGNDEKAFMIENATGDEVGFCCNDVVYGLKTNIDGKFVGLNDDGMYDYDAMEREMVKRIQGLLEPGRPGHACIISEISWDNLRTVNATSFVITESDVKVINMNDLALEYARTMLDDPEYSPSMVY